MAWPATSLEPDPDRQSFGYRSRCSEQCDATLRYRCHPKRARVFEEPSLKKKSLHAHMSLCDADPRVRTGDALLIMSLFPESRRNPYFR